MITKRITAAVGAAALVVLGSATGAFATYGPQAITLEVSPTNLTGGQSFSGTATADQPCEWEITYAGPSTDGPKTGSGTSIDFTFTTTEVESIETAPVTAKCTYKAFVLRGSNIVDQSMEKSVDVTLNPVGVAGPVPGPTDGVAGPGDGGFGLADTGGPSLWLALGGATLTAVGAGAVIRSRRATA